MRTPRGLPLTALKLTRLLPLVMSMPIWLAPVDRTPLTSRPPPPAGRPNTPRRVPAAAGGHPADGAVLRVRADDRELAGARQGPHRRLVAGRGDAPDRALRDRQRLRTTEDDVLDRVGEDANHRAVARIVVRLLHCRDSAGPDRDGADS